MKMLAFFIPLGISASLTAISHVIINGTLSRADHAEIIIANYAIAHALFCILERPVLGFRQTSSALVKGKSSFNILGTFFIKIILLVSALCALIGFTPLGDWVFIYGFNAVPDSKDSLMATFRVISAVIFFSGLRCLYQGIIINHLETKWVTVGVIIRLVGMFGIATYLIYSGHGNTSMAGAIIFLTGMAFECLISVWRGHTIINRTKNTKEPPLKKKEIQSFYTPLVFYLSFQSILIPIIYALLGKIQDIHMGIASFALAISITNLVLSFFMYTHQIVLQFFERNKQTVLKCIIAFSIAPSFMLSILCFTPVGIWFMRTILGADLVLARESLDVLKFFIVKTFVFPWVDYFSGILMLQKSTKTMLMPQIYNIVTVVLTLIPLVYFFPALNGRAGAIAASTGELIGLLAVYLVVSKRNKRFLKEERSAG